MEELYNENHRIFVVNWNADRLRSFKENKFIMEQSSNSLTGHAKGKAKRIFIVKNEYTKSQNTFRTTE